MRADPGQALRDAKDAAATAAAEFRTSIDDLRGKIVTLKEAIRQNQDGPSTREEAMVDLDRCLQGLTLSPRALGVHHFLSQRVGRQGGMYGTLIAADPIKLMVTICKEQIRSLMAEALDADVGSVGGYSTLPLDQRLVETDRLKAQLLALEVEEEEMIRGAEEIGLLIDRRVDADARAVLGLQDAG